MRSSFYVCLQFVVWCVCGEIAAVGIVFLLDAVDGFLGNGRGGLVRRRPQVIVGCDPVPDAQCMLCAR
jgi:hypothetical protein